MRVPYLITVNAASNYEASIGKRGADALSLCTSEASARRWTVALKYLMTNLNFMYAFVQRVALAPVPPTELLHGLAAPPTRAALSSAHSASLAASSLLASSTLSSASSSCAAPAEQPVERSGDAAIGASPAASLSASAATFSSSKLSNSSRLTKKKIKKRNL